MGPKGMPVVQSPGEIHQPAVWKHKWYREIPTGLTALGMTDLVVRNNCSTNWNWLFFSENAEVNDG